MKRQTIKSSNAEKGSVLLIVLTLAAIVSLTTAAFFASIQPKSIASGQLSKKKRSFYVAEGTRYLAVALTQEYLANTVTPSATELSDVLKEKLPPLMPEYFVVDPESIEVEIVAHPSPLPIPNGPFTGMIAPQSTVRFTYDVKTEGEDSNEYQQVTNMTVTMALAQLGLFQFMYFIDLDFADFNPGPPTIVDGRIHVNGDFCVAGEAGVNFSKITASGRLMHGSDSRCAYSSVGANTFIASTEDLSDPLRISRDNSNGCTNCGGTSLPWQQYALSTWRGNVHDQAHGVPPLMLPIPPDLKAQLGADGDDPYLAPSNDMNLRFLIDPVLSTDSTEIRDLKYAGNSDLRIIDGVWYLKNPSNEYLWPGIAIWSDHPGRYMDQWGNLVGQDDLRAYWADRGRPWPTNRAPRRFSYYEYNSDPSSPGLQGDTLGVISYGNLARNTGGSGPPRWTPGHWISSNSTERNRLCGSSGNLAPLPEKVHSAFTALNCTSGPDPGVDTALLNGTRSGLRDGHILKLATGNAQVRYNKSKILPMNFDAGQFQEALKDLGQGELGSYFGSNGFMRREFNGVVYMSLTWPGSEDGYSPKGLPDPAPIQGEVDDSQQLRITSEYQQQALPFPLCSLAISAHDSDGDRKKFDSAGLFTVPECESGANLARPNSIRIVNGAELEPGNFEKGLSLVSNLPVYINGGFNTKSMTDTEDASPWMSAMVAGDQVTFLSDNWDDSNSPWSENTFPRKAVSTQYNLGIINGWARSRDSVQVHAIPSLLEDWQGQTTTFYGSIVVGFHPVYYRHGRAWDPAVTYAAGQRHISFDKHFTQSAHQPPGSPLFFISAVIDWKAK